MKPLVTVDVTDLDQDGSADLLIRGGSASGYASVFKGPIAEIPSAVDVGSADFIFDPELGNGTFLPVAGMVGSGEPSLALSAFEVDGEQQGEILLWGGPITASPALDAAVIISGNPGQMGYSLFWAEDLAVDGSSQLLASMYTAGTVWVIDGPVTVSGPLDAYPVLDDDRVGFSDFGQGMDKGDLNGDGVAEVLISAPCGNADQYGYDCAGSVYVVDSLDSADLPTTRDLSRVDGQFPDDTFGSTLSADGDLNGDGYDDLLVGAHGPSTAYVIHGPVSGVQSADDADAMLTSSFVVDGDPETQNRFAWHCQTLGDIDGDGHADALIAEAAYDVIPDQRPWERGGYVGRSLLVWGPLTGSMVITAPDNAAQFLPPEPESGGYFGRIGFSFEDYDEDGLPNFGMLGNYTPEGDTEDGYGAGAAYLISAADFR